MAGTTTWTPERCESISLPHCCVENSYHVQMTSELSKKRDHVQRNDASRRHESWCEMFRWLRKRCVDPKFFSGRQILGQISNTSPTLEVTF